MNSITVKIFRITLTISGNKQSKGGRETDFLEGFFPSLGLLLVLFGVLEATRIPIYYFGFHMPFEVGSKVVPYIIVITTIPLILEQSPRGKHAFTILPLALLLLIDFTIGHYCLLIASIVLWAATLFLNRNRLRLNETLPSFLMLSTIYVGLVGLYVLVNPLIPAEIPLLDGFAQVLWKAYLTLAWPAVLMYTLLPYIALILSIYILKKDRNAVGNPGSNIVFKKEVFSRNGSRLILIASIGLAAYLSAYNYFPKTNPQNLPSGVDIKSYAPSLYSIITSSNPVVQAFSEPLSSTRPFYMLFLYSIHRLTGLDAVQTAKAAPIILLPLLVSSYYLLAERLFKLRSMGALTAVLTLASIQCPVGLFASYQANFLGLAMGNFLAVLTLAVEDRRIAYPLVSLLSFSLMLIHSWTSLYYVAAITVALAYLAVKNRSYEGFARISLMLVFTLLSKPFIHIMQQPVEGSTDPAYAAQATLARAFSTSNLEKYWSNTYFLFTNWCQGFMSNAFIYILTIMGIAHIHSIPKHTGVFLTAFLLALIPLPLMDYVIGSRMYFNIPLQVYASMTTYSLLQGDCRKRLLGILLGSLTLVYSILAVANIYFP